MTATEPDLEAAWRRSPHLCSDGVRGARAPEVAHAATGNVAPGGRAVRHRASKETELATLLVANAGGHLAELVELLPRLDSIDHTHPTWVTFDTDQAGARCSRVPT